MDNQSADEPVEVKVCRHCTRGCDLYATLESLQGASIEGIRVEVRQTGCLGMHRRGQYTGQGSIRVQYPLSIYGLDKFSVDPKLRGATHLGDNPAEKLRTAIADYVRSEKEVARREQE